MLLSLSMVMHEPRKASASEVYLLRTTDGSVPRGWDPNKIMDDTRFREIMTGLSWVTSFASTSKIGGTSLVLQIKI